MKVEMVDIKKIVPYARNPRNNQVSVPKVAASLKEFGWQQPIVVDNEMLIIAGHTRYEAARTLKMKKVPVHVANDLTPAQVKAYRIADNRLHEDATWDMELLTLEIGDLETADVDMGITGFDPKELEELLNADAAAEEGADELNEEDFETFTHQCPKCGFEWDE